MKVSAANTTAGEIGAAVQRAGRIPVLPRRAQHAHNRGQQAQRGDAEQEGAPRPGKGNDDGGGHGGYIGIEQVGSHAGHVAHVVAHIVRAITAGLRGSSSGMPSSHLTQ